MSNSDAGEQPRFKIETPDDWVSLTLNPVIARKEIKQLLAQVTWPNIATRSAVRDQMESAVSSAREAGALLLMFQIDAIPDESVGFRLFVGSLTLAPVSTAPHTATYEMVAAAVEGEGDVTEFTTDAGVQGCLLSGVEKSDPATASLRSDFKEQAFAQAYLPVPEQPWVVVGSCHINGRERLELAQKLVTRMVSSLTLAD